MSLSAQEEHDLQMSKRKSIDKAIAKGIDKWIAKGSRKRLKKLLIQRSSSLACPDPIEAARKNNPGLSREKALEIAEAFGF
jgi:hypothetical protein